MSQLAGLGQQPTDLQRLPAGSYLTQFLNANPEQQALTQAMPALLAQLSGVPGSDVLDPLRAISGRNLEDSLTQMRAGVPNRMSSAALWQEGATRQRSAQDFNLLASQIMEQGRARQIQAAQMLGVLSGQAGMNPFQRAMGAGQLGLQAQGQQMQALMSLLAPMMGAAYGGPMIQGTSGFENLLAGVQTAAPFVGAPVTGGASLAFAGKGATKGGGDMPMAPKGGMQLPWWMMLPQTQWG